MLVSVVGLALVAFAFARRIRRRRAGPGGLIVIATVVDTRRSGRRSSPRSSPGSAPRIAFSFAILGAARFAEANREGRGLEAALFGALALLGLLATAAAIVFGDRRHDHRLAPSARLGSVRAARNIAIIAVLALIVAVVPGGDNAARAIARRARRSSSSP